MRDLRIVTGNRADYGIYRPLLAELRQRPEISYSLIVTGMHLSVDHGETVRAIERDGHLIEARLPICLASDTPGAVALSVSLAVAGFSQEFARSTPDCLVLLGDRYEMLAAALAAHPFKLPVAHLHGGELTEGSLDDAFRHCLTKLSHLHFVSHDGYRQRVEQLGEDPERIVVAGALGLDSFRDGTLLERGELTQHGFPPGEFLLVSYHPATLHYERAEEGLDELLAVLQEAPQVKVFVAPNGDTSGWRLLKAVRDFTRKDPRSIFLPSLDSRVYLSALRHAEALVGNSSSGIIEAPSLGLPVVDVGDRQKGRVSPPNVIHCGETRAEIRSALVRAVQPAFRHKCEQFPNPYDRGGAARIIADKLCSAPLDDSLVLKQFVDWKKEGAGR